MTKAAMICTMILGCFSFAFAAEDVSVYVCPEKDIAQLMLFYDAEMPEIMISKTSIQKVSQGVYDVDYYEAVTKKDRAHDASVFGAVYEKEGYDRMSVEVDYNKNTIRTLGLDVFSCDMYMISSVNKTTAPADILPDTKAAFVSDYIKKYINTINY